MIHSIELGFSHLSLLIFYGVSTTAGSALVSQWRARWASTRSALLNVFNISIDALSTSAPTLTSQGRLVSKDAANWLKCFVHRWHIGPSFDRVVRSLASIVCLLHKSDTFFAAATITTPRHLSSTIFLLVWLNAVGWSGSRRRRPQRGLRSPQLRIFDISSLAHLFPHVVTVGNRVLIYSIRRFEEIFGHLWRIRGSGKYFYSIFANLIFCDHIILIGHEPRIGRATTLSQWTALNIVVILINPGASWWTTSQTRVAASICWGNAVSNISIQILAGLPFASRNALSEPSLIISIVLFLRLLLALRYPYLVFFL